MKESKPEYQVQTLAKAEASHVHYALELYEWNLTKAAKALDINRRTLGRIIERNQLEPRLSLTPEGEKALDELESRALAIVQCPKCTSELEVEIVTEPREHTCTECGFTFVVTPPNPGDAEHAEASE